MPVKVQCTSCKFLTVLEEGSEFANCTNCKSLCKVPTTIEPGLVVDDYLVKSLLGKGGKGNVYLAHELTLDRDVALKVLEKSFQNDPEEKELLLKEARSVASLNHPNIVHALKFGEFKETLYFVMELVEGETLQHKITKSEKIEEDILLQYAVDIARALKHAWEKCQLVHSDIKPDNIMISHDGSAKLTDLGLAQHYSEKINKEHNVISGTPQYISPEQVLGEAVDLRSDIYSLGATLFHAVTGRYLFTAGNVVDMVMKHVKSPAPSAQEVNPGVSNPFSAVISKMVAKKKEERYQTCDELIEAFNECIGYRSKINQKDTVSLDQNKLAGINPETDKKRPAVSLILGVALLLLFSVAAVSILSSNNQEAENKTVSKEKIEPKVQASPVKEPVLEKAILDKRVVSFSFEGKGENNVLMNRAIGGSALNGEIVGAVWTEGVRTGKKALEFNNSTDHVKVRIPQILKSFTITTWIKLRDFSNEYNSILCSDEYYREGALHLHIGDYGQITSAIFAGKTGQNAFEFDAHLENEDLNKWKFLAMTYNSEKNAYNLYIDGKHLASKVIKAPVFIQIDNAQIGNWAKEDRHFNGMIGELEIYEVVLNGKQIHSLFKAGNDQQ